MPLGNWQAVRRSDGHSDPGYVQYPACGTKRTIRRPDKTRDYTDVLKVEVAELECSTEPRIQKSS